MEFLRNLFREGGSLLLFFVEIATIFSTVFMTYQNIKVTFLIERILWNSYNLQEPIVMPYV